EQWGKMSELLSNHGEIVATRTLNMQAGKISEFIKDVYAYNNPLSSSQLVLDKCSALSNFSPKILVVLIEFPKTIQDVGIHSKEVKEFLRNAVSDISPTELFLSVHSSES